LWLNKSETCYYAPGVFAFPLTNKHAMRCDAQLSQLEGEM